MLIIRLFNFLKGYLRIRVNGRYQERFLNVCARRGIYLWDVARRDDDITEASISIDAFKRLVTIAHKTRCYARITARCGLPFYIRKYRKRYAMALGCVACGAILFFLTTFLWSIEIVGNDKISPEEITELLDAAGLSVGVRMNAIDPYEIERRVMNATDKLAWLAINLRGTVASVEVIEAKPKPNIVPKDEPCDIVASRYGVIHSIDVKAGEQTAQQYDIVQQGQMLASGVMYNSMTGITPVHAIADVKAYTWHEKSAVVPEYELVKRLTGNKIKRYELKFLNFVQKFYKNTGIAYDKYDKIVDEKKLSFGTDFALPISFIETTYYEAELLKRKITQEEALDKLISRTYAELDEQTSGAEVLKKSHSLDQDQDGKLILTVTYECLEDIAQQQPIDDTGIFDTQPEHQSETQ